MRKIKLVAVLAITCAAPGVPGPASAQHLLGDFDANDALSNILAGDGLTASETGDALYNRLSHIRGDLNTIKYGGVDDTEAAEYRELYTDGLAVLDRMDAEVARSGGTEEQRKAGADIVAGWRADFVQDYGGLGGTERKDTEHVRVCDTVRSGFFYIPGTDTCLRITGNVRTGVSWIENTHELGSGTVVTDGGGDGNENFGAQFDDWIQREGIGIDVRLSGDFGGASIGKLPITGVYGGYEGAWGDAKSYGSAMIGYDGVTGVGYTYFEPDGAPGAIANANGFGLETRGDLSNSWNRVNLGLKVAVPLGDDDTGPRVRGRIGGFYEDLVTKASGSAQLTYNGSPYAGYSQDWNLEAKDRYVGLRTGLHVGFEPRLDGKLKTSIGGDLYLGHHSGEGSYMQHSVTGGTPIDQRVDYSKNGFAVGAALTASASYEFAEGWKLGSKVEWSCLPQVTSFKAPSNPDAQADAGFSSEHASRVFVEFRLSRKF